MHRFPGDFLAVVTEDSSEAGDKCVVVWNPAQRKLNRLGIAVPRTSSSSSSTTTTITTAHQSVHDYFGISFSECVNRMLQAATEAEFAAKRPHLGPLDQGWTDGDVMTSSPHVDDDRGVNRRSSSAILEISLLLSALVKMNVRTLAFCKV